MSNVITLPPILSGSIVTDGISGAQYVDNKMAFVRAQQSRYADTPTFDPNTVPRGARAHLGGGVWMARCRECDDYALTWGSITYIYQLAHHEATHAIDVPGYNTPLIP